MRQLKFFSIRKRTRIPAEEETIAFYSSRYSWFLSKLVAQRTMFKPPNTPPQKISRRALFIKFSEITFRSKVIELGKASKMRKSFSRAQQKYLSAKDPKHNFTRLINYNDLAKKRIIISAFSPGRSNIKTTYLLEAFRGLKQNPSTRTEGGFCHKT